MGCSCCGFILNSCATAPITDRKQLKIVPEAKLNAQAAKIFEKVKKKEKLSNDIKTLKETFENMSLFNFENLEILKNA